jgi:thiazole synthase
MTETTNKTVMHKTESDPLVIAGEEFSSRLFLGTSSYPNQQVMLDSLVASGAQVATMAMRRVSTG